MTLMEQCLGLPYKERLNLCAALMSSIKEERAGQDHPGNRCGVLMRYMEEIMGVPIPYVCRESNYVWARAMVAYQMTREGFSTLEIGRMMDKTHATIIHLRDKMRNALKYPIMHQDIIELWTQFQNKIQDDIQRNTTEHPVAV